MINDFHSHYLQIGTESTVTAKYLLINDSCYRQTVEAIRESLPQFNVEATFALVVEPVYSVDRGALVVAS